MPRASAIRTETPMPMPSRWRLAAVSTQSSRSPVRASGTKATRRIASPIAASGGSSLSFGFSASRIAEAVP
jgi:hypothetical protein